MDDDFTYEVFAALDADGGSPAIDVLDSIRRGEWTEDPELDGKETPNDEQIHDFNKIMAGIKYFAQNGVTAGGTVRIGKLRDGLWEFKEGYKRLSFFDTNGDGECDPKHWNETPSRWVDDPGAQDRYAPYLDPELRLGFCFGKPPRQQKTEEADMQAALQLMREDLSYDRTEKAQELAQ